MDEFNALDFDLAKSIGEYFQLQEKQMNDILKEIRGAVKNWKTEPTKIGISKAKISLMSSPFKF